RLLPDHDAMSGFFAEKDFPKALYDMICRTSGLQEDSGLIIRESPEFPMTYMGSDPVSLAFLRMLIVLSGARRVLEVGSFIGVSAMVMAQVLPPEGIVVTIEKFDQFAALARDNFRANGFADRISLLQGDALDILRSFDRCERFDFFF